MPLLNIFEQLPWELISAVLGFLPTHDLLSLLLVNKEHYRQFYDEFVRVHLAPPRDQARRDWGLVRMYINAIRYDSVDLLKTFLAIVERDRAIGLPTAFHPTRQIGDTPGFAQFGQDTVYDPSLPFLPSSPSREAVESAHLRFCLIKPFTYLGLAIQSDAPQILSHLYNLGDTKTKLLETTTSRSYAWYKAISTLAKALSPDALQQIKDEALHIAAKSAFPRTTRLLLAKGANPNS
ncbi:hypothetical protein N0V85_003638 [Neurospora sp. IMI 360204]|nr:hypothetical protein N0V85_003638 [Neurospora sp. IMI 360204]